MRKKLIGLVFTVCLMCSACTAKNQSEQPQSSDLNQASSLKFRPCRKQKMIRRAIGERWHIILQKAKVVTIIWTMVTVT